jgi:hypothetical protein
MTSISQIATQLKRVFGNEANRLAKQAGLRQRQWTGAQLLSLLVFGWMGNPQAGLSSLVRIANSQGKRTSKQALDAHMSERTATFLWLVLQQSVRFLVSGPVVTLALLQRFAGVFIEDGSKIALPAALSSVWKGCGGNREGKQGAHFQGIPTPCADPKTEAGVKLTVRWDLLAGTMDGPHLQAARAHELSSVLRQTCLPQGSLWIGDLGYFVLVWLQELSAQGVFFLMRYKDRTVLWVQGRRVADVIDLLPKEEQATVEVEVECGGHRQIKARLLAQRVPEAVAQHRRARLREAARKRCKPASAHGLELCGWTMVLTNVPADRLSLREAFALLRARWQIELLFKLWKEQGLIDQWSSQRPWHVLCELYAKLIAMVVQHWMLIAGCWDDPYHSLPQAAGVMRQRAAVLLDALTGRVSVRQAVKDTIEGIRVACSIPSHPHRPRTADLLLGHPFWGLT